MFKNIRTLYTPIQPSIKKADKDVNYREVIPAPDLLPYVYCYWELYTTSELNQPFIYRVVTDGCIDIFFNLTNASECFAMGFCKTFTEFSIGKHFHYVGIRFLPSFFSQIFEIDASLLSNTSQELKIILPELAAFIETTFKPNSNSKTIKSKLDDYLLSKVNPEKFEADPRLYEGIDLILKNYGVLNLTTDLNIGISQRQLRRLFKFYIGASPKAFCQVVRFQNILKAKPSKQSLQQNKLFYNLGFYDQAHFIKDFKQFYGVTPSKAFGR